METRDPRKLKNYIKNIATFGDGVKDDFVDSVRTHGVHKPLLIDTKGTVISGHRRRQAAIIVGLKEVPVEVHDVAGHDFDMLWAMENRYRMNLSNEAKARYFTELLAIEKVAAKERQKRTKGRGKKGPPNSAEQKGDGESRDKAAKSVGLGRDAATKAAKVVERIDELESEGDAERASELRETLNKSVNRAHKQATGKTASVDEPVGRAKRKIPELVKSLRLQFGNVGLAGKFEDCLTRMERSVR